MIESFNIQAVIDIMFAIVVVAACFITMSQSSRGGSDRKNAKWRDELIELQSVLKELIENAGIASNNLDRRLLKRKEELEVLLQKIEDQQKLHKSEELPNPSWSQKKESVNRTMTDFTSETEPTTVSEQQDRQQSPLDQHEELERLISFAKSINQDIEKVDEPMTGLNVQNFANQIDPSTYKIAKRLIAEGHEINVIARKLEMPLAQVRLLDRIIRNETSSATPNHSGERTGYGYDQNTRQVVNGDY